MTNYEKCFEDQLPVSIKVYTKDLELYVAGESVEIPDPNSRLPIIELTICDSCKELLRMIGTNH